MRGGGGGVLEQNVQNLPLFGSMDQPPLSVTTNSLSVTNLLPILSFIDSKKIFIKFMHFYTVIVLTFLFNFVVVCSMKRNV